MSTAFANVRFSASAYSLAQLPRDHGVEVAFCGRSNVGKSSALNAITGHKRLARTSKAPGCTTGINLYALDEYRRLVDLPGFGYARVSQALRHRWAHTLSAYLQHRRCLRGLVLVVDIRRGLTPVDEEVLTWCQQEAVPVLMLLTKADKLGRAKRLETLRRVRKGWGSGGDRRLSIELFSATSGEGVQAASTRLLTWLRVGGAKKSPGK